MEAQVATPHHHHHQQKAANLARTFTKLLRRKRSDAAAQGVPEASASVVRAGDYEEECAEPPVVPSLGKLKLSGNLAAAYSFDAFFRNAAENKATTAAAGPGAGVGVGRAPPGEVTPEAAVVSLLAMSRGTGSHGGATSPPHRAGGRLEADARGGGDAVLLTVPVRAAPPRCSPRAIGSPLLRGCAAAAPPRRSPMRLEAGSGRARKKKSPEMWVACEI
jgi:hypothetical protein